MSNASLILAYPDSGQHIRTLQQDDEVLFCLADIVALLSKMNTKLAEDERRFGLAGLTKGIINKLDSDERVTLEDESDLQAAQYVTQPGLFRIILADDSPACKRFQRWVLHEVLPSIQKYGTYPPPTHTQVSEVKRAVELLLDEINERERLERETKERFEANEQKIQELSERVLSNDPPNSNLKYLTIEEFCAQQELPITDSYTIQKLAGWCIKICAEDDYRGSTVVGGKERTASFPEIVLTRALDNVLAR